jgi:hypothetical protein
MSAKHLQQFKFENILGVNSDLSQDVGALLYLRTKGVQNRMALQGSSTTQNIQDTAVSLIFFT